MDLRLVWLSYNFCPRFDDGSRCWYEMEVEYSQNNISGHSFIWDLNEDTATTRLAQWLCDWLLRCMSWVRSKHVKNMAYR